MPHGGMCQSMLAVLLLVSSVYQASAAGGWFMDLFTNPIIGVQQRLQEQQHRRLAQLQLQHEQEAADFVGRALQQLEQQGQQAEPQPGGYGYGSYGYYDYGYGYGDSQQQATAPETPQAAGSSRSLLATASNLAPTIVYDENVQRRILAGLEHQEGIELPDESAAVNSFGVFELPVERQAARKLLMANSDLNKLAAQLEQPVALQPVDMLLAGPTRALLQDTEAAGGYGGYGYGYGGYGYGYGYGYGDDDVSGSSINNTGRSLLDDNTDSDEVKLYNLWLQSFNSKHHQH